MIKNKLSGINKLLLFALAAMLILSLILIAGDELSVLIADEKPQRLTGITCETVSGTVEIALPATLKSLAPRTPVTLNAQIPSGHTSLLVKSAFSPMRVYLNDLLTYEFGRQGSYPDFMNDPPTGIMMIPLPANGESVSLRIEYLSPSQRSEISLPSIYMGSEGSLISMMLHTEGFSLLFSFVLIFIGAAMLVISLVFLRKVTGGMSFLWLGMFSLVAGLWVLGECDLSAFLIPYPSLLYGMAYLGLFCTTITFLKFGLIILDPKNKLPIRVMIYIHLISIATALLLQHTGTVDLMKTLYWFHLIAPLGFVVFAADLLWEYFGRGNNAAIRFVPAVILLAASVVLEVLNYWLKLAIAFTALFQLGLLAFILLMGFESGRYVRDTMQTTIDNQRLASENASLDRMDKLKTRLMETISHEARTPLAVLASYAELVSLELRETGVDSQITADLDKVAEEAVRVANLIDGMRKLTFTSVESVGRVSLDICEVAWQTTELYRHILTRSGIKLTLTAEESIPPVLGSPEELTQVLLNLLQNAKNHTESGSVDITVKNYNKGIAVTVADTGSGIASEFLPRVFERGVSGGGGSGIGLSLCKEIVEAHGGTIKIECEQNRGTIVTFTLPACKEDEPHGA